MQTLAQILAGVQGDPTQVNPGISPLIQQAIMNQQLAPGLLGQQGGQQQIPGGVGPTPTSPQPPMPNAVPPAGGIGSMGAMALPYLQAAYS